MWLIGFDRMIVFISFFICFWFYVIFREYMTSTEHANDFI